MLNILVVEENINFAKILINKIIQENKQLRLCTFASDEKEVLAAIEREKIDIILLDLQKINGLKILKFLEENKKEEYKKSIILISKETNILKEMYNNSLVYAYVEKFSKIEDVLKQVNRISEEKELYLKEKKH